MLYCNGNNFLGGNIMSQHYSELFKQEVIAQFESGNTAKSICEKYGIARSTLFLWRKERAVTEYERMSREQYLQQQELTRLRIENDIYRNCACSPNSPLAVRLSAIYQHRDEYSLHALCRILQVHRATYYNYASRFNKKTQLQLEDESLKPLVHAIFEKSGSRFGARKIRAKLLEHGYAVSERRILRLMKELDISAKPNNPRLNSANDRKYQYYPNKLKRNFLTDAPNMVWVSDITYAKVGLGFMYLCVIIDLYSRKVVAYRISEYITTKLVSNTFLDAFNSRGKPESLTFHSDQGSQYTSLEFCMLLKEHNVTQSFSAPGAPHDNAVAESFFATIKKEDFRRTWYKTENEFQEAVDKFIDYYNDYRPHQRLGFMTPDQVESEYFNSNNT